MKKQISPRLASIIFSILIICFAIVFYTFAAWQEPTSPQPGGNVLPPINVSNIEQYKAGGLGIGGVFRAYSLAVFDGNVGIGTTGPSGAKLEVAGQVKITGGTPGAGKVLTSDANGLASWQAAGGGGGGGFQFGGMYTESDGSGCHKGNPYADGLCACPTGYTAYLIYTDPNYKYWDGWIYFCGKP